MLSQFQNFVKDNQADIVLVISIILIALISFGLGRLTAPEIVKEPVTIEEPLSSQSAAISGQLTSTTTEEILGQENIERQGNTEIASTSSNETSNEKGIIVASKYGKKYHWPWCSWAKKIKPENQVWFKSEAEAQKAGYQPCGAFKKLAPVDYKP